MNLKKSITATLEQGEKLTKSAILGFGIALMAIGGTLIAATIGYVGTVLGTLATGHPSW